MAVNITTDMLVCDNSTWNNTTASCEEETSASDAGGHRLLLLVTVVIYSIICVAGTVGNTAVVSVIVHSYNMRSSVTNIYIVNLAVSDFFFLAGLPTLIVTALRQVRQSDDLLQASLVYSAIVYEKDVFF